MKIKVKEKAKGKGTMAANSQKGLATREKGKLGNRVTPPYALVAIGYWLLAIAFSLYC